jgi:hypothetical protein
MSTPKNAHSAAPAMSTSQKGKCRPCWVVGTGLRRCTRHWSKKLDMNQPAV